MLEIFKMTSGDYDQDVLPDLVFIKDLSTRGHSKKLYHRRSNKAVRKNFFTNRIVPIWNSLPEHVVTAPNKNTFKNRLDEFWKLQPMKYKYREPYFTGTGLKIYLAEED